MCSSRNDFPKAAVVFTQTNLHRQ